jgi:hypothetical protein
MARILEGLPRWPQGLQVLAIFVALGSLLSSIGLVITFVGQSVAIGPRAAWELFGWSDVYGALSALVWLSAVGLFMGGGILVSENFRTLQQKHPWLLRAKSAIVPYFPFAAFPLLFLLGGWLAFDTAKRRYADFSSTGRRPDIQSALLAQRGSLESASTNVQKLLSDLDSTEKEIASAKAQLRATLSTLEQQLQSIQSSTANLKEINDRQAMLRMQIQALQDALGGQEPITRRDLQVSNRWGQAQGFVTGFFSSLAATWTWQRWQRKRRRSSDADGVIP